MEWPKFKLWFEHHKNGWLVIDRKIIDISDDEHCYVLSGWNTENSAHSATLHSFVQICTSKGFTWALHHGHPKNDHRGIDGSPTPYISFGRAYRPQPAWDVGANNPGGQSYVIETRHRECLEKNNINFISESGGGHNLKISREDLAVALDAILNSQDNYENPDSRAEQIEKELETDRSIGETERVELIKARRGQGIFRNRVLVTEPYCRLTGVSEQEFLRASHIKPWVDSDNKERLDGNNGLMLSPHVDHLFDRGYISFEQSGRVLVASNIESIMSDWSLPLRIIGSHFSDEQEQFLAWHRANCFLGKK